MKTRTLALIAGIFAFGLSTLFGQEMHKEHSGHMADQKKAEAPDAFQKQLTGVLTEYLALKDALVASDESKAETAAKKTLKALGSVDMSLLKGDAHMKWMGQLETINSNLNGIVSMKGIEMKRSHFSVVSDELSSAVKSFGIENNETVYIDYCPMANNNNGAYWLSADKEIRNPYFGDKMLKCGKVKETIE